MVEQAGTHLEPNREDMRTQLTFLFGDAREYDDGLIEIAVDTIRGGWFSRLFEIDRIDDAIAFAVAENVKQQNIYLGAALRDPDADTAKRASDEDFYCATSFHGDLDDAAAVNEAVAKTMHCKPHLAVCTGKVPDRRMQLWWKAVEPVTDPELYQQVLGGIADTLDGDRRVTNPGRVMRLGGSIAWPTKPGRVPELTFIANIKAPDPTPRHPEELLKAYPVQNKVFTLEPGKNTPIERAQVSSLGLNANTVTDGREAYMRDTILAVLIEFIGQNGATPTPQELYDAAWPQYAAHVDFSRPGRGPDEMARKIASTLRRFEAGRLRGLPDIDAALERYKAKQKPAKIEIPIREARQDGEKPASRFQWITRENGVEPVLNSNWLVKHVLPAEGLGVIFGRPGSGKTFTVMDIAMHVAAGLPWRGKKTRAAAVSYVSPEAGRLGVNRVIGWSRHHGIPWPEGFRLSPAAINLCSSAEDAEALIADVQANQPDCRLVVIDTLNRAMAGGDENSGEDMGRFVALCDHIAKKLRAFVLVVHHSGKDAAKGSRGHSSLLGAVSLELEVTKEQGSPGTIKVTKMRDGEDGAEYGFDIDSVPLGVDEDGEEVTTGISIEADAEEVKAVKTAQPKGRNQHMIADAFAQFVDDHGRPNPAGTGFAEPGRVMVVDCDPFVEFAAGKMVGGRPHEKRKSAREAIHGLVSKGYFCVNGNLIWRVK